MNTDWKLSGNISTVWKVSKYGVISGPYFPVFGLNTEIYSVNLRIQSEHRKIRTRNNSLFGQFSHSVEERKILIEKAFLTKFTTFDSRRLTTFNIEDRKSKPFLRDHSFSMYAKFSEKLTFFTPWYARVSVRIMGQEMLVFLENFAYVLNEWSQMRNYFLKFFHSK